MSGLLDSVRNRVRAVMRSVARLLNALSRGQLSPNAVTLIGLLAHLPIAYFIAYGRLELAAVLLVIFGLFDTLDGELARLQNRSSSLGMLLDSSTDRMKEIFLYTGVIFYLVAENQAFYAVWAAIALGGSLLTSYINAWGEVVTASLKGSKEVVNKAFRGGLLCYEIRMFLLIVALVINRLPLFVVFIGIFAWVTAIQRLMMVSKRLR